MTEELPVETPEDTPVAIPGDNPMSVRDAAKALAGVRWSRPKEEPISQPEAEPQRSPLAVEAGLPEAAPETDPGLSPAQEAEPAVEELPPIEPPRSWTKEEKEEFQSYPREAQEKIARREQERETALRRGQNEAAEHRRAIESERQQMEQARKQYEETLPVLLTMLDRLQSGDFADIKTPADVERLAREDWPRYAMWDAHQKKVQAIQGEMRASQDRQQQEYQAQWSKWSTEQDAKFNERNPGIDKAATEKAVNYLKDRGFSDEDLNKSWSGAANWSPRDARVQEIILDAMRYREARAAVPKAVSRPVPKVQKPGSPAQRVPDADAQERALYNRLDETRGNAALRLGAQLLAQRRSARQ